jgi:hypothetical protein
MTRIFFLGRRTIAHSGKLSPYKCNLKWDGVGNMSPAMTGGVAMSRWSTFSHDPHWIVLRHPYTPPNGTRVPSGTRAFYYPNTGTMLFGEQAKQAAREFASGGADEKFMPSLVLTDGRFGALEV